MWVVARQLERERAELRNGRKLLPHGTLKRELPNVSARALTVNPWVAAFRNDPSTRGKVTVFERPIE